MATPLFLYDFLAVRGGAERVLQTLHEGFGGGVVVGFVDRTAFPNAELDFPGLDDLRCHQRVGALKIASVCRAFLRLGATARGDTINVFSGSYAVLAARSAKKGQNIFYCHTPPRFLYDLKAHYQSQFPVLLRPALALLSAWLKPRYEAAVQSMGLVIANSENVKRRLKEFLDIEAVVVHPPIETTLFRWLGEGDYYLSSARLEPLKRVELIIQAFLRMPDKKLVVASSGSESARLRTLAAGAPNIQFTGWISNEASIRLVGEAIASIYIPKDEDFGMSPVESMAAGKPVIGVAEGGLLETLTHGLTGLLLPAEPTVEALVDAVSRLTPQRARSMRAACEARAAMYSRDAFLQKMARLIQCPLHSPRSPHSADTPE